MDDFSLDTVWNALTDTTSRIPILRNHLFVYDVIDSTNTECKRRVEQAGFLRDKNGALTADGERLNKSVVAAAEQTAGRGRLGRVFYSPSQTGIYFSIVYVPEHGVTDPALFTVTAAVGVCRAIDALFKKKSQIKWVNDVYLDGKKVCGILTEGVTSTQKQIDSLGSGKTGRTQSDFAAGPSESAVEAAIIGIGINILVNDEMPVELASKAGGSLGAPSSVSRAQLLARVIIEVMHSLDTDENVIPEYRGRSVLIGKRLVVTPLIGDNTTSYETTALDITSDAGLLVQLSDGSKKILHSGEVSLHDSV